MTRLHRAALVLNIALATVAGAGRAQAPDDPRTVARLALRAVEGDTAAALRARWSARLGASADDRAAALGIATLDRLGCE
jgi:hypothetical protein